MRCEEAATNTWIICTAEERKVQWQKGRWGVFHMLAKKKREPSGIVIWIHIGKCWLDNSLGYWLSVHLLSSPSQTDCHLCDYDFYNHTAWGTRRTKIYHAQHCMEKQVTDPAPKPSQPKQAVQAGRKVCGQAEGTPKSRGQEQVPPQHHHK